MLTAFLLRNFIGNEIVSRRNEVVSWWDTDVQLHHETRQLDLISLRPEIMKLRPRTDELRLDVMKLQVDHMKHRHGPGKRPFQLR